MSATSRTTLKQTKIVLVWVFFLIYKGKGHETFKPLQLVGFIILVTGIMLYNEILIIPFFGFNEYTSNKINDREKKIVQTHRTNSTVNESDDEPLLKA